MHTPLSIAIGSILLIIDINNIHISKKAIADKLEISEVTITKAFKKVDEYKNILLNDELVNELASILEKERAELKMPQNLKDNYFNMKKKEKEFNKKIKLNMKTEDFNKIMNQTIESLETITNDNEDEYKELIQDIKKTNMLNISVK